MPGITKRSTKKKSSVVHVSYIVGASSDDHWIDQRDLDEARTRRDAQYVHKMGREVAVDGFRTAADEERRDRNMMKQLITYLATPTVTPMDAGAPFCSAFAHTCNLTPEAKLDRSCMTFRAPHLVFDVDRLLKQVMKEEKNDADGAFAPFAARHVKKVMRILPNFEVTNDNGVARNYHVEMCVLTGMGILVARGLLYLNCAEMASVTKSAVSIKFKDAHINWQTWGFDAERLWSSPWSVLYSGCPFR